jgi:hypothetical protein
LRMDISWLISPQHAASDGEEIARKPLTGGC